MRMDDWDDATFWDSFYCKTDGVDRGEPTESSSNVKGSDAADVDTETPTLVGSEDRTELNTSNSARKFEETVENVKPENNADIERDKDSPVHFQQPRRENVDVGKDAAAESSALLPSPKHKDAKASKIKQPVLRFEEDFILF